MIILDEKQEWPTKRAKNMASGLSEITKISASELIFSHYREWQRQGSRPTHILVGMSRRHEFIEQVWSEGHGFYPNDLKMIHGLRVIWTMEDRIELFSDKPIAI